MYDSESIDRLKSADITLYEFANGQNPKDAKLSKKEALTFEAIEYVKLRNSHYYESDSPVTEDMEKQMAWLLYKKFQLIDDLYSNKSRWTFAKLFKRVRLFMRRNVLGHFMRVRVRDNYVENIRPSLYFSNKIRHFLGMWVPVGADSPFGRLVDTKATAVGNDPIITNFTRLSGMGKNFKKGEIDYNLTYWRESRNL